MLWTILCAQGWVILPTGHYGAQPADFAAQALGSGPSDSGNSIFLSVGCLWSMPAASDSTHGLGGGITYAWDPVRSTVPPLPLFHR